MAWHAIGQGADGASLPIQTRGRAGLNVLPEDLAQHLADYENGSGDLVLGPRSGMKGHWNALWPQLQPGPLVPLLGGRRSGHDNRPAR